MQPLFIVPITHQSPEKRRENWDRAWKKYDDHQSCNCNTDPNLDYYCLIVIAIFIIVLSCTIFIGFEDSVENNKQE